MKKLTAAWMMLLSTVAFGAGFKLDVHGSRAIGMGGAVTAFIDDPSAIYYNPAGLAGRKGFEGQLGIALIIPMLNFTHAEDGNVTSTPFHVSPPPHGHFAYGITEDLAIGVGMFSPYGASSKWPPGWEGRFKALTSQLQIFDVNPTIAYRLHPRLKFGVGFNAVRGTVVIERNLDFIDSEGTVTLGGGTWGFGWNIGAQVEVVENRLFFGATYRSAVTMKFEGRAHFEGVPEEFGARLKDQPITAKVALPTQANFGLTFKPMDSLILSVDADYVEWSSFTDLTINFENPDLTVPLQKSWVDQVSVHVGGEFKPTSSVAVRLGVVWDPTPSPRSTLTPDLPDSTRVKITAGVGWQHKSGFGVDLGYQFVILTGSESFAPGFEGSYGGTAQVIGLTLGYKMSTPATAPVVEPDPLAPAGEPAPAAEPPPATEPAPAPAPEAVPNS
ncbi:MAG: fadL [Myxococcaceae bacterium]|nr:fadL [Myxococcaceae bacterium]